jgi:hypothetical protein
MRIFKLLKSVWCWVFGGCKLSLSAEERMKICKKCDWFDTAHFPGPRCSKCGCILEFKTKMETEKCPLGKW